MFLYLSFPIINGTIIILKGLRPNNRRVLYFVLFVIDIDWRFFYTNNNVSMVLHGVNDKNNIVLI